ncbi:MAG: VIT domain-containing protein [Polyangia bacterium]
MLSLFDAVGPGAKADVPPGPWRRPPGPTPRIIWTPVKPIEPELVLARPPSAPPMSLTSSDGAGLQLVSLSARAVVEDPLTFTELRLTFKNPQPRTLEGQFEITLPPRAAISRFAMRQGEHWQEGEVVELQAARQAYEDFLHRRQDPALLEKQAGNQFRARVFPIPPSGEKELIISYSAERVRDSEPYRIYLRGLPKLERLDIRALVARDVGGGVQSSLGGVSLVHQTVAVQKNAWTPDNDFEVAVPVPQVSQAGKGSAVGLRHQNLVLARISPTELVTASQTDPLDSLLVLFDTSASRALGFGAQVGALGELVAALKQQAGPALPLRVLAFDQDVEEIFSGSAGDFGKAQLDKLAQRQALGASDLGRALSAAAQKGGSYHRALLITDGVVTAGQAEATELKPLVQALGGFGVRRLDVVAFGGIRDDGLLGKLTSAGLPSDGLVLEGEMGAAALVRKIERGVHSGIAVSVPGSQWVWPLTLDAMQPGDQALVYADLPADKPFEVVLTDRQQRQQRVPVTTVEVARPLLERSWIGARIQRLSHQRDTVAASDPDLRSALVHQIVDISTKHRVLSDYTALLILETEQDYARFRIDRRALSDILTVGVDGIDVIARRGKEPQGLITPMRQEVLRALDGQGAPAPEKPADASPRASSRPPRPSGPGGAPAAGGAAPAAPSQAPSPSVAMNRSRGDRDMEKAKKDEARSGASEGAAMSAPMAPPPPPPPPPREVAMDAKVAAPRSSMPMPKPEPMRAEESQRRMSPPAAITRRPPPPPHGGVLQPIEQEPREPEVEPYEGKLRDVMNLLKARKASEALQLALKWRAADVGDVLALIALGESWEALGQKRLAARAYGSIIDLFPGRADLRRFAGSRLLRLFSDGVALAADTFAKARAQRPDHPSSHRMLAYALLRQGKLAEAFEAIHQGASRDYPAGRFAGVTQVLREDAGLIAAAWLRKEPQRRQQIEERLRGLGAQLESAPSVRFILSWETDANDVDFHIYDGRGGHASYQQRQLPSGGELYADVTTGYGPECFNIPLPASQRAYPYKLKAHYYSRGPMGYGMGALQILEHDGKGGLRFSDRPFVIMADRAFVDLGEVRGPLSE